MTQENWFVSREEQNGLIEKTRFQNADSFFRKSRNPLWHKDYSDWKVEFESHPLRQQGAPPDGGAVLLTQAEVEKPPARRAAVATDSRSES